MYLANFASALAIELRRSPSDARDFLSFKFRNGSEEDFRPVHIFGHREDIPLTEFIYRVGVTYIRCVAFNTVTNPRFGSEICDQQQQRMVPCLWRIFQGACTAWLPWFGKHVLGCGIRRGWGLHPDTPYTTDLAFLQRFLPWT